MDEPRWIHIGIDDEQAKELLARLADDDDLRSRLEENPREVLLKEFRIDLPSAPERLQLPPREQLVRYRDEFRKKQPFGRDFAMAHGFVLLWVAHGNGWFAAEESGEGYASAD